LIYTKKVSY